MLDLMCQQFLGSNSSLKLSQSAGKDTFILFGRLLYVCSNFLHKCAAADAFIFVVSVVFGVILFHGEGQHAWRHN